ncbi:MAG: DUF1559 domain-containing protein [Pirellulales bacterium]
MPIDFACPHCGNRTQVADQYAGMSGPCSRCGQTITVPSPGAPAGFAAPSYSPPSYTPPAYGGAPSYGGAPGYPGAPAYGAPAPAKSSGKGMLLTIVGVAAGVLLLMVLGLAALLIPAISSARQAARRVQSGNNMKMIGLAMHNYHDTYGNFPLAGSDEPAYGLQMSWRVRLLPFVEQGSMFNQIDFNQPWNAGQNAQFNNSMPNVYQSPAAPPSNSNTVYVALVDSYRAPPPGGKSNGKPPAANDAQPSPIFSHDGRATGMARIIDGTSNTLLFVEADAEQAVPWMAPQDIVFDPQQPKRGIGKLHGKGFQVMMADGSVRFVANEVDDQVMRNLVHKNDGNPVVLP